MPNETRVVTGGVDTHKDVHVVAVVDERGKILDTASFPATAAGYEDVLSWLRGFGDVEKVGVEGTGSYGAGLTRHLRAAGVEVVEVNRPNRQLRRRRGKSDTVDAEAAARAALCGEASGTPKTADGAAEALRTLRVARRSAVKARTQAGNQIRDLIVSASEELRGELGRLSLQRQVTWCARCRPGPPTDPTEATKRSLRLLARRYQALSAEITELDQYIAEVCADANPALLAADGVGPEVASALLVAAGDNPERMRSDASFAALCGVSPVEASSGKITRHRLNRGGNRDANNALWRIAMVRLAHHHPATDAYLQRRRQDGKGDREILRCLKRYIAREMYYLLTNPTEVPQAAALRQQRITAGISLTAAAHHLGTTTMRLSRLERGVLHHAELATTYQHWLTTQQPEAA